MAQVGDGDRPGPGRERGPGDPRTGAGGRRTMIGAATTLHGRLAAREDVWVEGSVEGEIEAPASQVTLAAGSRMRGQVRARSVVVAGELLGDVRAEQQVTVSGGGRVQGDIFAPRVALEDGAHFVGRVDMTPAAEAPAAGAARPTPAALPDLAAEEQP